MQESYASQHIYKWYIYKEQNISSVSMSSKQAQNECLYYDFKWEDSENLNEAHLCDEVSASLWRSQSYHVAKTSRRPNTKDLSKLQRVNSIRMKLH